MSMIPMNKEALEQLRSTIRVQNAAIAELHKAASSAGRTAKQASTVNRVTAATLVDTLVANGSIPATSRTNVMEKLASDHSAALEGFLSYVQRSAEQAPSPMGGVDKSASFGPSPDAKWGDAGAAFESQLGLA
jgi:hypothetical protein